MVPLLLGIAGYVYLHMHFTPVYLAYLISICFGVLFFAISLKIQEKEYEVMWSLQSFLVRPFRSMKQFFFLLSLPLVLIPVGFIAFS